MCCRSNLADWQLLCRNKKKTNIGIGRDSRASEKRVDSIFAAVFYSSLLISVPTPNGYSSHQSASIDRLHLGYIVFLRVCFFFNLMYIYKYVLFLRLFDNVCCSIFFSLHFIIFYFFAFFFVQVSVNSASARIILLFLFSSAASSLFIFRINF